MTELARFDQSFYSEDVKQLAGTDEAGRGPLAGPVVAAICSMTADLSFDRLGDSKDLNDQMRRSLDRQLRNHQGVVFAISFVQAEEIDRYNIHTASLIAMARSLQNLEVRCDFLLIDGKFLPHRQTIHPVALPKERSLAIVRGDRQSQVIAAASILAKVARDDYMIRADQKWPAYGFAKHKGYPTQQHIAALLKYGPCSLHRQSFRLKAQSIA